MSPGAERVYPHPIYIRSVQNPVQIVEKPWGQGVPAGGNRKKTENPGCIFDECSMTKGFLCLKSPVCLGKTTVRWGPGFDKEGWGGVR